MGTETKEGTEERVHTPPTSLAELIEGGTQVSSYAPGEAQPGDGKGEADQGAGTESEAKGTTPEGAKGTDLPEAVTVKIGETEFTLPAAVGKEITTLRGFQGAYDTDVSKLRRTVDDLTTRVKNGETAPKEDPAPASTPVTQEEIATFWDEVGAVDTELSQGNDEASGKFTKAIRSMANLMGRQMDAVVDARFNGVVEHLAEYEASMEPTMKQSRDFRDLQDIKERLGTSETSPTTVFTAFRNLQVAEIEAGGDEDQVTNGYGKMFLMGKAIQDVANGTTNGIVQGETPSKNSAGPDLDPVMVAMIEAAGGDASLFKTLVNGKSKLPPGSVNPSKIALSGASAKAARDKNPSQSVFARSGGNDANAKVAKLLGL